MIASIVGPFAWGLVVHWLFSRLPGRIRAESRLSAPESLESPIWDYYI